MTARIKTTFYLRPLEQRPMQKYRRYAVRVQPVGRASTTGLRFVEVHVLRLNQGRTGEPTSLLDGTSVWRYHRKYLQDSDSLPLVIARARFVASSWNTIVAAAELTGLSPDTPWGILADACWEKGRLDLERELRSFSNLPCNGVTLPALPAGPCY